MMKSFFVTMFIFCSISPLYIDACAFPKIRLLICYNFSELVSMFCISFSYLLVDKLYRYLITLCFLKDVELGTLRVWQNIDKKSILKRLLESSFWFVNLLLAFFLFYSYLHDY